MLLRPLNDVLQKVASENLNEKPEQIEENLQTFRKWIAQQAHLKSRTDAQFLVAFLRNCKYDVEKAKQKLDNYYAYIEKDPELFRRPNLNDKKIRKLLKCGVVIYLPQPVTVVGPRVLLVRSGAYDPTEFTFDEITQFRQLMQDVLFLDDDIAVVCGLMYIMDFSDASRSHYLQVSPAGIRQISQYMEEAVPLNLLSNHFIDTASTFTTLFNLVKPFMPTKAQSKMHVHGGDREELYQFIPKEILPAEYGGQSATLQVLIDQWEEKVLSYVDYFSDNDKFGVDESLRVKNTTDCARTKFLGIF